MVKLLYLLLLFVCAGWTGRGHCSGINWVAEQDKEEFFMETLGEHRPQRMTPPSLQGNQSVSVSIAYYINQIVDLDEKTGRLETTGILYVNWTDERLTFPADVQVSAFYPRREHIWTPDIALYNMVSPGLQVMNSPDQAMVMSNGSVAWIPLISTFTLCDPVSDSMSTRSFSCSFRFGSWVHSARDISLSANMAQAWQWYYRMNANWEMSNISVRTLTEKYPCCPDDYESVILTFNLERRTSV